MALAKAREQAVSLLVTCEQALFKYLHNSILHVGISFHSKFAKQ